MVIRTIWQQLPNRLRQKLRNYFYRVGFSYCVVYFSLYEQRHTAERFAGNLAALQEQYRQAGQAETDELDRQFADILESLVMKNGVTKKSYFDRCNEAVSHLLSDSRYALPSTSIRVLDVPSSTGVTSLGIYELLSARYQISEYVLGDLFWRIIYDKVRECVFDETKTLIQVRLKDRFFSLHRPHVPNIRRRDTLCLLPLHFYSRYLAKKYRFDDDKDHILVHLVHPKVQRMVENNVFRLAEINVFQPIEGPFDLILSFNLLHNSYFGESKLACAMRHLTNALDDRGVLVAGNTKSFKVWRKTNDELELLGQVGEF